MIREKRTRPMCQKCNENVCMLTGKTSQGFKKYKKLCITCHKAKYNIYNNGRKSSYSLYKKDKCELCGFIPIHRCQLDVDHIDGDSKNNEESNLQTLCANCHRLKTYRQKIRGN